MFGMGTGVAPPAMPPGIEFSRRRYCADAPSTETLEPSQALLSHVSVTTEKKTVVKPHGRLVPVS